jgi:hypothetical protein
MAATSGGAVDHRAAQAALDSVREAVTADRIARQRLDRAIREALAVPGVTQGQVAALLGISARGLRKRLDASNRPAAAGE